MYNQVQLPWCTLLIGYVQTVHAWPAQGGKDVHTHSSTILDKGRDVECHIIHSYP